MKKIFWDVDTQYDFMYKEGALYVPNAEEIIQNLSKLTDYAFMIAIPILGSVDKHFGTPEYASRETELQRNGGPFPDHCMNGTKGQEKIEGRLLYRGPDDEHTLDNLVYKGWLGNAIDVIELSIKDRAYANRDGSTTLFFEKQSYDVFTNPSVTFFLQEAGIKEAVVYGVATDYCVRAAVLGMQKLGIQCFVVEDTIRGITPESSQKALEEMIQAGVKLITTNQVLKGKI